LANGVAALDDRDSRSSPIHRPDGVTINKQQDIDPIAVARLIFSAADQLGCDTQVIDGVGITRELLLVGTVDGGSWPPTAREGWLAATRDAG